MITCPCCNHSFEPEAPAAAVTPRQRELLNFIGDYIVEHNGVSPNYDDMRQHLGVASKSAVNRLLVALEDRGLIRRKKNMARAIVVVGASA